MMRNEKKPPDTITFGLGIDLGSTAAKAVLVDSQGRVIDQALDVVNLEPARTAEELRRTLLDRNHLDHAPLVATGYGRSLAGHADKQITEISCHARGIRLLHPDAVTVLDIGGQDAKAIRLSPDGNVDDFAMNDRCAAGTGRFLEVAARRYGMDVAELSAHCGDDPSDDGDEIAASVEISSTCVVFAESELVGLRAKGVGTRDALRAVHRAIARRVALLLKQVGVREPVFFTGGVAQNKTLCKAIGREIGMTLHTAHMPQFTGALGAALFAAKAR